MRPFSPRPLAVLLTLVLAAAPAAAQPISPEHQRSSSKVLRAFKGVVERPSQSTVRVRCDGKDVALGTVVDPAGWIVTKASDLQGTITCRLPDGRELAATVVGADEPYDLAVLKVDAKDLAAVAWRPAQEARVGQWVASPSPAGDPVAVGVVSVGPRKFRPGDQPPKNLGSKSGYLGVGLDEAEGGARIMQVMPKSPAERAGLKVNDIVIEADGKKVLDNESLINIVQRHHPGEEVTFRVRRGTEEMEMKATLDRLPRTLLGNPQERMGNPLSARRGGFPTILQHDSVLKPEDCGGPLVDLDGKALGVNIARAGRTETYAVPSEDVLALLPDLKSGKKAPTVAVRGPESPRPMKFDPNVILRDANRLTSQDPAPRGKAGCHSRAYSVKLAAGDQVVIELESLEFDAFLRLEDSAGKKLAEDDDGLGDLNARIQFRAPRDDSYRIIVTSFTPGETGSFELVVRRAAGDAAPQKK